jgi:hypothetical protein
LTVTVKQTKRHLDQHSTPINNWSKIPIVSQSVKIWQSKGIFDQLSNKTKKLYKILVNFYAQFFDFYIYFFLFSFSFFKHIF